MNAETGSVYPVATDRSVTLRMSRQRRRDTAPEMAIRRELHRRGLRFRLQEKIQHLPRRTIDIAFVRARVAVFVDGCFWHGCPIHATYPANNAAWWAAKLTANKSRDVETTGHLQAMGWAVVRIWEHEEAVVAADRIEVQVRRAAQR